MSSILFSVQINLNHILLLYNSIYVQLSVRILCSLYILNSFDMTLMSFKGSVICQYFLPNLHAISYRTKFVYPI